MSDPTEPLTPPWAYYRRTGLSEMRPYVPGEDMTGVSVSASDYMLLAGNPDPGGFIARNPKNHADKWYVAQAYFEENLEPVAVPVVARDEAAELRAALEGLVPVALALTDLAVSGFDLPPGTVTAIAKARAALAVSEGES